MSILQRTVPVLLCAGALGFGAGEIVDKAPAGVPAFAAAGMDTSVRPCDDFDRYANGGWKDANPVPGTESRWGSFDILAKENRDVKVRFVVDSLSAVADAPKGSDAQLVGDLYRSYMDTAAIEAAGIEPLRPLLDKIAAVQQGASLAELTAEMQQVGVGSLLRWYAMPLYHDSRTNGLYLAQGGLSLRERSYYEKQDSAMVAIRAAFVKHVDEQFAHAGLADATPGAKVLRFEEQVARLQLTNEEARDPQRFKRVGVAALAAQNPGLPLDRWTAGLGITTDSVYVQDLTYVRKVTDLLAATPIAELRTWLTWKTITAFAGSLPAQFADADFAFYQGVLGGTKEQRPREERALRFVDGALGQPIGKAYAAKYFPASSRKRVEEMIENVRTVYADRIDGLTWMSAETKVKAKEKLAAFTYKIGYPDVWKDYSTVAIAPTTLVANRMALARWASNDNLQKVDKPVDTREWMMSPQTVNAYYSPLLNEVVFPAGILQPPFFNPDADDAINYGGIITVIGHELTHGFDDKGSMYDGKGELSNWWTPADSANFGALTNQLVAHFNGMEVLPGVHIRGAYTLGENIADLGGVTLSYHALERAMAGKPEPAPIDGFTWRQRFFLGYAQIWRGNITDAELRRRIETDPHSPGRYRVNGILGQLEEFKQVWCPDGQGAMLVPDSARVRIW